MTGFFLGVLIGVLLAAFLATVLLISLEVRSALQRERVLRQRTARRTEGEWEHIRKEQQ